MEKCSEFCILEYADKGFKFVPSGQQICETYLKLMIEGKKLPCRHMIAYKNMYEEHSTPWEIFKSDDSRWVLSTESSKKNHVHKKIKKVMYVFTMLKNKGQRVLRKAGCGTWTGQNKNPVLNEQGDCIGFDRLLTFKVEDVDKKINHTRGNWTMHEYSLHPNDCSYAICKITKEEDGCEKHVVDEQESLHNYEEFIENNILHSDVALQEFTRQNHENHVQVLDQEYWGSYAETLNQILESQQEERDDNIVNQFPIQELSEENMINELSQPQKMKDNRSDTLDTYLASDTLLKPRKDYEEAKDTQSYRPLLANDSHGLVEEEQEQVVLLEEQHQSERMAYISHLAENFDYYYGQQQQQLEGGRNNSLGKRKNRSYPEQDFSNNKKQQNSFICSFP